MAEGISGAKVGGMIQLTITVDPSTAIAARTREPNAALKPVRFRQEILARAAMLARHASDALEKTDADWDANKAAALEQVAAQYDGIKAARPTLEVE